MEDNVFGVVIKVENIDICRSFYRDILQLGPPEIDSNFWVEFKIPGNASLLLERKEENEKIADSAGRISWIFSVKDVNDLVERLRQYGFEPLEVKNDTKTGIDVYEFCDPEGNLFYIKSLEKLYR